MPHIRAGAASIHDPLRCRAEDRVVCGEHTWMLLSGTVNQVRGANEADAALPAAEALVRAARPGSVDDVTECFLEMGRLVKGWAEWAAPDDDLWSYYLGAVALVVDDDVALMVHVGLPRVYRLSTSGGVEHPAVERLTVDHSLVEMTGWAGTAIAPNDARRDPALSNVLMSSVGPDAIPYLDARRVPITGPARLLLTSPGANRGLETPLGYLREVRSPAEFAQRLCVEARAREGARAHHASAIVVDVDPEPTTGPYR